MAQIKINKLPSGVYSILEFKHQSNIEELWGEEIQNFEKNWIGLSQKNIIVPG